MDDTELDKALQLKLYGTYHPDISKIWEDTSLVFYWIKKYQIDIRYHTLLERYNDDMNRGNWMAGCFSNKDNVLVYHTAFAHLPEKAIARCLLKYYEQGST